MKRTIAALIFCAFSAAFAQESPIKTPNSACDDKSPWPGLAGTLLGGLLTLAGGWVAHWRDSKERAERQAADYQLRIWMELQDALEGIDNVLGKHQHRLERGAIAKNSGSAGYAKITIRARIQIARLTDKSLLELARQACKFAETAIAAQSLETVARDRGLFLREFAKVNDRINELIQHSHAMNWKQTSSETGAV